MELRVAENVQAVIALLLELTRFQHSCPNGGAVLLLPGIFDFFHGNGIHFDLHVDAVQQRPADLAQIALDLRRRAGTGLLFAAVKPAGAGIHARHQHTAAQVSALPADPGNGDEAILQRLAQCFQRRPLKLRKLIQKKNPVMGQGNLSRLYPGPAADHGWHGNIMMGRSEGTNGHQAAIFRQLAGCGMD